MAKATGLPHGLVGLFARRLIEAGVLPKGRGSRSGWAEPKHAAQLLLALLATSRPNEGPIKLREYGRMTIYGERGEETLLDFLSKCIEASAALDYEVWQRLEHVDLRTRREPFPSLEIQRNDGHKVTYLAPGCVERVLEKREQVPEIKIEASLGGTVLTHLGAFYGGMSWAEAVAAIKQRSGGVA